MTKQIETIIRACCVCHNIWRRDHWADVGEPIYKFIMNNYEVSHIYCEPCAGEAREEIKQIKLRRQQNAIPKPMPRMQGQLYQTNYSESSQESL